MGSEKEWDGFRSWLHSIAVVTFDLELGQVSKHIIKVMLYKLKLSNILCIPQVIENLYPGESPTPHPDYLSEHDRTNVCYLAFPDSNSGIMGDTQFHFRIRRSGPRIPLMDAHKDFNARVLPSLQLDTNFLFGFAYFRQVKDPSIRRGYYQKSVILLSYLPLVDFLFFDSFCHLKAVVINSSENC